MNHRTWKLAVLLALALCGAALAAKYKIKPLEPRPAAEYAAHQDFQNVVIGAFAAFAEEEVLTLFDSKKVHEKKVLPVLVVIENNNSFPLQVRDRSIFLILKDGTNVPTMPAGEAFLQIVLKKPPSSYGTHPGVMIGQLRRRNQNLYDDIEHKSLGERLIAPHDSDYGVVFFPRPSEEEMEDLRLYLPEVENVSTSEELIFFEFALKP